MFKVIEEVWKQNSEKIGERSVYFAREGTCTMITRTTTVDVEDLATDHDEEADTKIAYLIQDAANTNHDKDIVCVVRSNSGDIDIPIILLGLELERNVHVYIDNGTGKNRRVLALNKCDLNDQQRNASVGVHAFNGNDYIANFHRKGKKLCWKQVCKNEEFLDLFATLGTEINVIKAMYIGSEKYVC